MASSSTECITQSNQYGYGYDSYTWKITDSTLVQRIKSAKFQQAFDSPIFSLLGLQWYFTIYPKGNTSCSSGYFVIYAHLIKFPSELTRIEIDHQTTLIQTGMTIRKRKNFKTAEPVQCWDNYTLQLSHIKQFHELSFKWGAKFVTVYDANGKKITEQYSQNEERKMEAHVQSMDKSLESKSDFFVLAIEQMKSRLDKLEQKVKTVESRMNSERKDNNGERIDNLVKEMKLMKQNINNLSLDNNSNSKQQKLKMWVEHTLELPQYYEVFIKNGIADLSTVSLLTMETIKAIGIDLIGHQMKILKHVIELKGNKNKKSLCNEGGTELV